MKDTYLTIKEKSPETLFKDKGSKFFGYAFPLSSEEEVKPILETLKNLHSSARHFCYAYQLGTEKVNYRANDDGEPSNSAGMPIYGQIQSFELTNILVVSVRYFGGVKLGVGGLIQAYRTSAKLALEASSIVEEVMQTRFQLNFEYDMMNKVMRIVKEYQLHLVSQKMELHCEFVVSVRKKEAAMIKKTFDALYPLQIITLES